MTLFLKSLENFFDICLKNKHFQDYINTRFDLNDFIHIGNYYYALNHSILSVEAVEKEYSFDDIENTTVLDIGGNIGGFAIPASSKATHVYVVEPLFTTQLLRNIQKNGIKNITVFDIGLGKEKKHLKYNENKKNVNCIPFSNIIDMCGGKVDFLKMDCEGCEWEITKNDLRGIKRLEMELHCFNGKKIEDFLPIIDNFDCEIERTNDGYLIHGITQRVKT